MRPAIPILALALAASTPAQTVTPTLSRPAPAGPVAPRPNVVVVMMDDLGYGDLGVQGSTFILTPVLDGLASEGVRLTSYATSGSMCSPTRASMLAGLRPARLGFMDVLDADTEWGLPADVVTVAEVFRLAGYVTGHVGKWHLGEPVGEFTDEFMPPAAGFDSSARLKREEPVTHLDPTIVVDEQLEVQETGHGTSVLTEYALSFLDEHAGNEAPFFLSLWYFAPHMPPDPVPQPFMDLYSDYEATPWTGFAAMVSHLDFCIGQILARLQQLGVAQDTLVIVTSDNGGSDQLDLHPDGNGELRGFKRSFFEGGIRVPFLAAWPGTLPEGVVRDDVVLSLDLLPTALELTGLVGVDPGDGRSMLPVLMDRPVPPRGETMSWTGRAAGVAFDPADGIVDAFAARDRSGVLGPQDWKLVRDADGGLFLFDLTADVEEDDDLLAAFPVVGEALWDAFWAARAPETEIAWEGVPFGDVVDLGGAYAFDGGRVDVPSQTRFDVHDGDFTARATVTPQGGSGTRLVMRKPGSWNLSLDPTGRLRLLVTDDAGLQQALSTASPLALGQAHDVAFTVHAWTGSQNTVTLYVDGADVGTLSVDEVAANREPIEIGNTGAGTEPFVGVIGAIRFHVIGLTLEETLGGWPAFPGA